MTSNTTRSRSTSRPALHSDLSVRLRSRGWSKEIPTKTATVKRELALTIPSRAVT
ncbi:unnamed protein product [Arabidopsis lyrata]|nr:unnamed protein product [Arabidopsis lyrata]